MDTREVLTHHDEAFAAGDADEVAKDYAVDAVLMTADGPIRGQDAIHQAFLGFFSGVFAPGTYNITRDVTHVEGDVAFTIWHASCAGVEIPLGTETYVIRSGNIVAQTFAGKFEPK